METVEIIQRTSLHRVLPVIYYSNNPQKTRRKFFLLLFLAMNDGDKGADSNGSNMIREWKGRKSERNQDFLREAVLGIRRKARINIYMSYI